MGNSPAKISQSKIRKGPPCKTALVEMFGKRILESQTFVFLFEFGNTATLVQQACAATGPCGVRGWVNIQGHCVAFFAPS